MYWTSPVPMSLRVQTPSALQTTHGSGFAPGLHVFVLLSLIRPSLTSLLRAISKQLRFQTLTQHLKKPPSFWQRRANLLTSWTTEFKGKVVHFFRPTFPNPLPMLWMLIWGLFPIGPRLEHLHWIGSIGGVAGMPMLCQFQTMHYQSPANWE